MADSPKVNVTRPKADGTTPLYIACAKNHTSVVHSLLQLPQIDPNAAREGGFTPLYVAAQEGRSLVIQELLQDDRVDVNLGNSANTTALFVACYAAKLEAVQLLLQDDRVDVNRARTDGSTPLWKAAECGHMAVVKWLIGSGRTLDARAKSNKGHEIWSHTTASERARQVEKNDVAELIDEFLRDPERVKARLRRELQIDLAVVETELRLSHLPISRVRPSRCLDPLDVVYLNLSHLSLAELPEAISRFQNVKSIKLSANKLKTLPPALLTLPNLENLNLDDNLLGEDALEFTKMLLPHVNRVRIYLRGNPVYATMRAAIAEALQISIPEEATISFQPVVFESVTDLVELNLSKCSLTKLSPAFATLTKLVKLNLNNNPLTVETFQVVADLMKASKSLESLKYPFFSRTFSSFLFFLHLPKRFFTSLSGSQSARPNLPEPSPSSRPS